MPQKGQPADFSGLVGDYSLIAAANPTEVRVGEPITLTVEVAGPAYLNNVRLPPLNENLALALDFKIPEEMAPGTLQKGVKNFTQTLRAKHAQITAIPAIELSFFNPASGAYETARTAPIPLTVEAARVVTAQDAEGLAAGPTKTTIAGAIAGITYNYEGPELLANEQPRGGINFKSPMFLALFILPPTGYLAIFLLTGLARRKRRNPAALAAKKAFKLLQADLKKIPAQQTGESLQQLADITHNYLTVRLGLPTGALTFVDVEARLRSHNIPSEALAELKEIMATFETWRFAGTATTDTDLQAIRSRITEVASTIERRMP